MKITLKLFLPLCVVASLLTGNAGDLAIWHAQPAKNWNEATPVGNGRLGAMIFGNVKAERIQLNEDSLWSGAPQDADNPRALEVLPEIRQMLFDGKYADAQKLANRTLICKGPGSGRGRGGKIAYGSYETLGDLLLAFNHGTNEPVNYRRALDLERRSLVTLKTVSPAKAGAHSTSAHRCYGLLPRATLGQERRFLGLQPFFTPLKIGYLWFNLIGCVLAMVIAMGLQQLSRSGTPETSS